MGRDYLELRHCNICDKYYVISCYSTTDESQYQMFHGHSILDIREYIKSMEPTKRQELNEKCMNSYDEVSNYLLALSASSDVVASDICDDGAVAEFINNQSLHNVSFFNDCPKNKDKDELEVELWLKAW
jgi:hypothetical protein